MPAVRMLAAAQTVPVRGDVRANVESHVRLARAAAREGAVAVVFPELSLTGYELDRADALAFTEQDPRLDPLRALASSSGTTILAGAPVRLGARLHIGAFIVCPDRSLALYTKRRLGSFPPETNPGGPVPPAEDTVFAPGDRDPLVDLDGHAAAVAVCADVGDALHPERAAARGAGTYIASMFFTPRELDDERARLRSYAERHRLAVVMANFGGPTGGLPAAGGSAVWSPAGALLAEVAGAGEGLAIAAVEARDGDVPGRRGRD